MNTDEMLKAVQTRDVEYDGSFVYAVKTTGVFCKPSCSSRAAKTENMAFYPTPGDAKNAGYRACKICSPEESFKKDPKAQLAQAIAKYLEESIERDIAKPTLRAMSKVFGYSEDYLTRRFKSVMGMGPLQYYDVLRTRKLKAGLKDGGSVTQASYDAGFGSSSRLYENSLERLGMSPSTYAKGGKGAEIAFAIVDCFLGRMLVAGTHHGVCAVYFGNSDQELREELNEEFPLAEIGAEVGELSNWAERITSYLEQGEKVSLDVPLDMYGTAFQRLVWQELLKIAPGERKTYKDIAKDLGKEKSSRAVGRACATNPVSLVVPCHRVLGSDGKLHGYRWGLKRKAALLEWEEQLAS